MQGILYNFSKEADKVVVDLGESLTYAEKVVLKEGFDAAAQLHLAKIPSVLKLPKQCAKCEQQLVVIYKISELKEIAQKAIQNIENITVEHKSCHK